MTLKLSEQSVDALAEIITGGAAGYGESIGLYRTGYRIEQYFTQLGVTFALEGATRVNATRLKLAELAGTPASSDLLRRVIERAGDPVISQPIRRGMKRYEST